MSGTAILENGNAMPITPAVRATAGAWNPAAGQQGARYFLITTAPIDWTVRTLSPL